MVGDWDDWDCLIWMNGGYWEIVWYERTEALECIGLGIVNIMQLLYNLRCKHFGYRNWFPYFKGDYTKIFLVTKYIPQY